MPAVRAATAADLTELSQADRDLCAQMSATVGDVDLDPQTGAPNKPGLLLAAGAIKFGGLTGRTVVQNVVTKALSRSQLLTAFSGIRYDGRAVAGSKTIADVAVSVAAIQVGLGSALR